MAYPWLPGLCRAEAMEGTWCKQLVGCGLSMMHCLQRPGTTKAQVFSDEGFHTVPAPNYLQGIGWSSSFPYRAKAGQVHNPRFLSDRGHNVAQAESMASPQPQGVYKAETTTSLQLKCTSGGKSTST
jgi:hypothetical protein